MSAINTIRNFFKSSAVKEAEAMIEQLNDKYDVAAKMYQFYIDSSKSAHIDEAMARQLKIQAELTAIQMVATAAERNLWIQVRNSK